MADFATSGTSQASDFSYAVRREVVVQKEVLAGGAAGDRVQGLGVFLGSEGDRPHGGCFAAIEYRGTVGAGKNPDLRVEFADFIVGAAVDALAVLQEVLAHQVDFHLVEEPDKGFGRDFFGPLFLGLFEQVILDGRDLFLALELVGNQQGRAQRLAAVRIEECHFFLIGLLFRDHFLGLAENLAQFDLGVDDLDDLFVAAFHRRQEILFGDFVGAALHHQKTLASSDIYQVQIALVTHVMRGVDHEFAVDAPDADTADRTHEGHFGYVQRGGGGIDRQDVGFVESVGRNDHAVDLDIVKISGREKGTDRTVDVAGGQDFLFRRTRLTLEITAGKTSGRIEFLAIFDLQREEIDALPRFIRIGDCAKNHGIA